MNVHHQNVTKQSKIRNIVTMYAIEVTSDQKQCYTKNVNFTMTYVSLIMCLLHKNR